MADQPHTIDIAGRTITTPRLRLRPWAESDAEAALAIFGRDEVARWLAPAMSRVLNLATMQDLVRQWAAEPEDPTRPTGRWAVETASDDQLIGAGTIRRLPPINDDLEIGWQLAPEAWGHGFATEAGHALAHYAFSRGEEELFAVVRPRNTRGIATARRVGMDWVGETDKYYGLELQVFRLRKGDLDISSLRPRPV